MTSPPPSMKQKVLEYFLARPRRRLTPLEILKALGAPHTELQAIVDSLRELAREGKIVRLKKNRYGLPGAQNYVTGRVQAHPDGFGFLIPQEKGKQDIYLNRREMRLHANPQLAGMFSKSTWGP